MSLGAIVMSMSILPVRSAIIAGHWKNIAVAEAAAEKRSPCTNWVAIHRMMYGRPKSGGVDMYTAGQLEQMRNVDITTVDKTTLVDLETIHIDRKTPYTERVMLYLEQIKNPYTYRVGDVAVKIQYMDAGISLQDAITSYLRTIKSTA
jgi:hypothetical protein